MRETEGYNQEMRRGRNISILQVAQRLLPQYKGISRK